MTPEQFEQRLTVLDPEAVEFPVEIDELVSSVELGEREKLIPAIFRFFQKHSSEYAGVPGTLVHLIEDFYPSYVPLLIASLREEPSKSAVLMVNRILNSTVPDAERLEYLGLLEELSTSMQAPPAVRDTAKKFIAYQEKRYAQQQVQGPTSPPSAETRP